VLRYRYLVRRTLIVYFNEMIVFAVTHILVRLESLIESTIYYLEPVLSCRQYFDEY